MSEHAVAMRDHMSIYDRDLPKRPANYQRLSPVDFLVRAARIVPDQAAIVDGATTFTYRDFLERSVRLAHLVTARGATRGKTVAILSRNTHVMLEAHFGVPMAGAVLNTINTRLDPATVAHILEHGEAAVFLVDAGLGETARAALAETAARPVVLVFGEEADAATLGAEDFETALEACDPGFAWPGPADEWDAIALNYTSGTTGDPKGVVYHHRGAFLVALANHAAFGLAKHCVYLWTLPMFHCNGWGNTWAITALMGTHVCLPAVDPAEVFRLIDAHRVTHMSGAPIVLSMLMNAPADVVRTSTHTVAYTVGGAPPPAPLLERMAELNFDVTHGYGLTETYGPASICEWREAWSELPMTEQAAIKKRQGVPTVVVRDMTVMDPATMTEVPADGTTIGEIVVRANTVMKGYLKNPAATEAAMGEGWFRSGDLGVLHPDGYVELVDRAKDIVISGGENISSIEVENVIYRHPAVLECAVIAIPHEKWGETPCAVVGLKPGQVATEEELRAWCRQHLAAFKVPGKVVFAELPKTNTGKIQKHVLRTRLGAPSAAPPPDGAAGG